MWAWSDEAREALATPAGELTWCIEAEAQSLATSVGARLLRDRRPAEQQAWTDTEGIS